MIFTEDHFRSNTLLEAVLPLLKALLEVFFYEVLQHISYSSFNVADYLKMSSWVVLDCQEEKKSYENRYGESCSCRTTAVFLGIKKVPHNNGDAVAQWLRCCATNQKDAGSIPAGVSGFFIDIKSYRLHYGPGVDSASNRNEYHEYFLGVKAAGA